MPTLIARETGGPECWCGTAVWTYGTDSSDRLNATPSEAAHMIPLQETLRLAVPMHLDKLRREDLTTDQLQARLSRAALDIGRYGDLLQYKARSAAGRRHTAEAFNALAYGIAVAATQPGGIHYGGIHWEATPAMQPAAEPEPRPIVTVPLPDHLPKEAP